MALSVAGRLTGEFTNRAAIAYRQRLLHEQRRQQDRRERREQIEDDAAEFADMVATFVTATEITEFKAELDLYDTATVAALQKNEHALEQVQERMDQLLAQAFVLPDGRRVFRTEDGLRVFDEHGAEQDAATIDPGLIPDDRPTWEVYKSALDQKTQLLEERGALIDYQGKLDAARERLDAGEISREEFDELREGLVSSMPEAVREQIPGKEPNERADVVLEADAEIGLDMASNMLPSSMTPEL